MRCGGVRIFALAFGGFACFLRFPRQGKRFPPAYRGVSPTQRGNQGRGAFPQRGMDPRSHGKSFPTPPPLCLGSARRKRAWVGLLLYTPKHVLPRQGAVPAPCPRPAVTGTQVRPTRSLRKPPLLSLPPSRRGLRAQCAGHIFHLGGLGGQGVYYTDVHRKPVVKFRWARRVEEGELQQAASAVRGISSLFQAQGFGRAI